jgi:hypothetical protein
MACACSPIPMPTHCLAPSPPRMNLHKSPRVVATSPPSTSPTWSLSTAVRPPPQPATTSLTPTMSAPTFHVTPRWLVFGDDHSPRVVSASLQPLPSPAALVLPVCKPIAHRTRSRAQAALALFASGGKFHECIKYCVPTAKSSCVSSIAMGFAGLCAIHHMSTAETSDFAALCTALLHDNNPLALSVLDPTTGNMLEHCQLQRDPRYKKTWDTSYSNELGRLCQGTGSGKAPNSKRVTGTNTFFCINFNDISLHMRKEICHTMVVCKVQPGKDNPNRTQNTIGGNRICYTGNVGTNTASLELLKLLLNSVLLQKGAWFSSIDLKNFYLDTPMPEPEYVCIKILDIPQEFIDKYKLTGLDRNGWIYFKICQGCYGLPQAGILANNLL